MRIALVHDYLCGKGGAERVFQYMCEEFPEADVFTLSVNLRSTFPYFSSRPIKVTWLDPFVRSMEAFRWSFPFATYAFQAIDLSAYDLVISSSATTAKYVRVPFGKHVCYCYIPTRAIWQFEEYFGTGLKSFVVKPFLPYLKRRDLSAAARVDQFIAISEMSREAIAKTYGRESEVIYCPVDLTMFRNGKKGDHFLLVSRLEYWKRVDYAVEAFNRLGLPLRIIGAGAEEARLKAAARPNITFLGEVDDATLATEYSQAAAVVFTPYLEYGLIPLEANASGTPVICYGRGGVTETLVPVDNTGDPQRLGTAIFFDEQTPEALMGAVRRFQECRFDPSALIRHASNWDVPTFKKRLRTLVEQSFEASAASAPYCRKEPVA